MTFLAKMFTFGVGPVVFVHIPYSYAATTHTAPPRRPLAAGDAHESEVCASETRTAGSEAALSRLGRTPHSTTRGCWGLAVLARLA
ncbi:uncharacterized protein B0T15DRAFT_543828, partial [Chaetomium strumarium]